MNTKHFLVSVVLVAVPMVAQTPAEQDRKKLEELKIRAAGQEIILTHDGPGEVLKSRKVVTFGGDTAIFLSGMNVGPVLKNAPYSAEAVNESIQTLADGNRIVEKSTTKIYRDSEGRERREEEGAMNTVFISDPVEKVIYTMHADSQTAEKSPGVNKTFFLAEGKGGFAYTSGTAERLTHTVFGGINGNGEPKEENLGMRLFDGVQAIGTRSTSTIAAGQIGNERPIEIVDERWYSPELQITVMTRHADPRSGETTYKLNNLLRNDSPKSLFEVPRNYTIRDNAVGKKLIELDRTNSPKKE